MSLPLKHDSNFRSFEARSYALLTWSTQDVPKCGDLEAQSFREVQSQGEWAVQAVVVVCVTAVPFTDQR